MKNKIKNIIELLKSDLDKDKCIEEILSNIRNIKDTIFIDYLIIEIAKKGKHNVFRIKQPQFNKLISFFIEKTKIKEDFENRVLNIIKETQNSGYKIDQIYSKLFNSIHFIDKIFVKISNIKNKALKLEIQNEFKEHFLLSNNSSISKLVILNKMKKHFEDEVLKELSINIKESDFEQLSFKFEIQKINYEDDFSMALFIIELTNSVIKKEVLNRENRLSDCFFSINEKSQEINILNKNLKDIILSLNASILYTNCKNKNFKNFNIVIKKNNLYSECFLEYYQNINNFLIDNDFFMALKESILFFEFYIRTNSRTDNAVKKEAIKIEKNKKELSNIEMIKMLKELKGDIGNKYINEYKEKKEKELLDIKPNIDKMSIETLLNAMNKSKKITNEELEIFNYLLLNNRNEGLNFRNKIFHSLILESDLEHEFGEFRNQLFFFITIYLTVFILKNSI